MLRPSRETGLGTQPRLLRRLLVDARAYWWHMGGVFALELFAIPLALLTPVPLKIAVDSGIGDDPVPGAIGSVLPDLATRSQTAILVAAGVLMLVIGLMEHLRGLASWVLGTYTGEKLTLSFRARLFRHAQRLSLAYHDTRGAMDSTYRIQHDAVAIQTIATDGVTPFVTAGLTLVAMLVVTALIDWQLALAILAVTPAVFATTRLARRLRWRWSEVKRFESSAMSVVQEALASLRVVKAFGAEDREQARFMGHATRSMRGQVRLALIEGALWGLVGMTLLLGTAVVLFVGASHVRSGVLTIGELLIVMAYMASITGPLETIAQTVTALQGSLASAERVYAVLDEETDVPERSKAPRLVRAAGDVEFRQVRFSYDGKYPVLRDASFNAARGTCLGIAGATGAGKTTLTSLLARFYDPDDGQILLDGRDLREYRLADLRNQLAIVLQEPVLFSTTIAENIAYARPGAELEQVIDAAKAANADSFISSLPDGYYTDVGERGTMLSGGQRQRIALARAFLKDAPILILDEPTSSVDLKTEAGIREAMEELMRGRTTFLISHRSSLLLSCDELLYMDSGRLHRRDPSACDRLGEEVGRELGLV